MKNILFVIAAATVMVFTSCYIGVSGGHRRHPSGVVIIADNATPKDSLKSSAAADVNRNDSLKTPVSPASVK